MSDEAKRSPDTQILLAEAIRHHQAGRLSAADPCYREILRQHPRHADARHLLGVIAHQLGRNEGAIDLIREAIAIDPGAARYHANLASVLKALGRLDTAVTALRTAIRLQPDYAEAHANLGVVLTEMGRTRDAVTACSVAICLKPDYAEGHSNLGNPLTDLGRQNDAVTAYQAAIRLKPDLGEAHANLGKALTTLGRLDDAVQAYGAALCLKPDMAEAQTARGVALAELGHFIAAAKSHVTAMRLKPDYAEAHSNLLMSLHYRPEISAAAILAEAKRFDARFSKARASLTVSHTPDPTRRLRIGYVSADFRRHPVGWFLGPVLAHHDPARVEVFCYSNSAHGDEVTIRLRASAHHWREITGLPDPAAAAQVAGDAIDILVDLSGHTAGNRLAMFALKPAPLQASWLGFWGTTGLSAMDAILSDATTIPIGDEVHYSEQVLRLPGSRFCYGPPDDAPAPSGPPSLASGAITFGSFNNLMKVGPGVVRLWAAILQAVPGSRLLLKWRSLADPALRTRLTQSFAAAGIAPERLELRGASPHREWLAQYGDIDIALDPMPFSGGLTSCEALWMGVPVVTLPGASAPSRQTLGFLQALGLAGWAARSPADYLRIAAGLAHDPGTLAALRLGLRARMAASPLCDGLAFTRGLESTYRAMWRDWCPA